MIKQIGPVLVSSTPENVFQVDDFVHIEPIRVPELEILPESDKEDTESMWDDYFYTEE